MTGHDGGPAEAATRFLNRLAGPSRILVAVSGGSDSIGLLLALSDALRPPHSLCAATIDHALRDESAGEALGVERLCRRLGMEHLTLRWAGEKPSSGIPAAARLARYDLLHAAAARLGADVIVTAHTADDQDETIAMRAARGGGEGRRGLSGMAEAVLYRNAVWIARPFLDVRRVSIRNDLRARDIGWVDDPSNEDVAYERARVRKRLRGGGADLRGCDGPVRALLAEQAAALVDAHARLHGGAVVHLGRDAFSMEPAVLRFALSGLLATVGGRAQGVSGLAMERLLALMVDDGAGRMTLGRVLVAVNGRGAFLAREGRGLPVLDLGPGETAVWDGRFRVRNANVFSVRIMPCGAADGPECPTVPSSVLGAGRRGLPQAVCPGDGAPADVAMVPMIAPHDLFLPGFDLAYGAALARLLGLPPYLRPAFS